MTEPAKAMAARRLNEAVRRHRSLSRGGIAELMFTWAFKGLVYPQIWEDPEIDMEALALDSDCRLVTIASGGCNVLSYLVDDPQKITAVDLNLAHVALNRLKLTAVQRLPSWNSFYRFFGNADARANIDAYWTYLAAHLDAETRRYWEKRGALRFGRQRIAMFSRNMYRCGLLGHSIGLAHLIARAYGIDPRKLLNARSLDEQRTLYQTSLAPLFEKRLVRWATAQPLSLYGLGIPPAQYGALAPTGDMADVLRARVERLACAFSFNDNYFAWQAFGRAYPDPARGGPLPPYLKRDNFAVIRARAERVDVVNRSFTEYLTSQPHGSLDRYVLLDAQDWMTDAQLNALWREITRTARPGARVIFRTAAEPSLLPGRVADDVLGRWRYEEAQSCDLTRRDRSAIYGGFHLYVLDA